MIYVTGDCHDRFMRFEKKNLEKAPYQFGAGDYVIICGDFGLLWEEGKELEFNINTFFTNKKFTILWVPGNHENYDLIKKYPLSEWNGGKVRMMSDNLIMLERGQVFTIEGKTFFTMGGASTHDAKYILDPAADDFEKKKKSLTRNDYRILGIEWWPEELPSEAELEEGLTNLAKYNYKIDYIITHCAGGKLQKEVFGKNYPNDCLNKYFDELEEKLTYKRWFFGHYHTNRFADEKHICLYEKIIPLDYPMPEDEEDEGFF